MKCSIATFSEIADIHSRLNDRLKRNFEFKKAKNEAQLIKLIKEKDISLILLHAIFDENHTIRLCQKIRATRIGKHIPMAVIVPRNGTKKESSWFETGVDDLFYNNQDPDEISMRLEKRVENYNCMACSDKHRQTLKKRLSAKTQELEDTQYEIVKRLSKAAEHRDPETGDHIHRMSHYCYCIAAAYELPEKDCQLLLHASPMHDVGKLGIPDSILLNPGKLTAEEWSIMQQHAEIGRKILSGSHSKLVQLGEIVAGTHHEKWDGSGYPNQLKGEEIPVWGRIAALADVFDAMTSKRVYQKAIPAKKALGFIKEQKGKHFDPELTDLFVSIFPKILTIKEIFPE